MRGRSLAAGLLVLAAAVGLGACTQEGQTRQLPGPADLEEVYGERATAEMNGNVVDVRARQSSRQLERGGRLWARVGPYIYLFSPQTRELFQSFDGVAAVRVRTVNEAGDWIAEATLHRDALNPITWKDARRVVARARRQGTDKPGYLEDLVRFGEEHSEHRYNPAYVDR